jgi:lipopolysaccharide export LptBFGC system permease protein LptF
MERVIEPVIADLQCEHADAVRRGQMWRAAWIRVGGCAAFWKTVGLHASPSINGALSRALGIGAAAAAIVTALAVLLPLKDLPFRLENEKLGRLVLYLIPGGLAVSLPVGLAVGVFCRLRGRTATMLTRRTVLAMAFGCSLTTFVNLGWISPASNQAFRVFAVGKPVQRGSNELTFGEMRANLRAPRELHGEALPLAVLFHARVAASAAPLVLCLLALSLSVSPRGEAVATLLGITTLMIYLACLFLFSDSQIAKLTPWLPPFAIAWLPNVVVILGTLTAAFTRTRQAERAE